MRLRARGVQGVGGSRWRRPVFESVLLVAGGGTRHGRGPYYVTKIFSTRSKSSSDPFGPLSLSPPTKTEINQSATFFFIPLGCIVRYTARVAPTPPLVQLNLVLLYSLFCFSPGFSYRCMSRIVVKTLIMAGLVLPKGARHSYNVLAIRPKKKTKYTKLSSRTFCIDMQLVLLLWCQRGIVIQR